MPKTISSRFRDRVMAWRSLWGSEKHGGLALRPVQPELPEGDADRVRSQMRDCLDSVGGEVSSRARAAQLGRAYLSLNPEGRERFLHILATEFGTDEETVDQAIDKVREAQSDQERRDAEQALREALESPRVKLLTQFNALPEGVKFLVDLRAELLPLIRRNPDLAVLEADLKSLLSSWFDVGFLELKQITWHSPAALLEKIIAYEAVHAIQSWDDLKNRLDSDRRLYAFLHPRMPDEPLIFVQVALVEGMASNVQAVLDETAPVLNLEDADTAIFYSISNAQSGLSGISFGNFLIKRVVDSLSHEFPNLKTYATLSPIPGFRKWLEDKLAEGEPGLLNSGEHKAIKAVAKGGAKGGLKALLMRPDWPQDEAAAQALKGPLTRLCARYLASEKRPADTHGGPPRALDPVAHFHLSNGARMERLNWLADVSAKGIKQSAGLMINYYYKLSEIDRNHETYSAQGKVAASSAVRGLLRS
ncbi:MAG: malonyl-CoA decarboxylase [Alphaproteobacteria bacterium]|nr:malonyl-CoA decarboxylase [Alphaproteobacteria bacterium]